ncbi:MAG: hypothetical protein AB1899_11995 [Pseudomonadota bacterium]
MLNKHLLPLAFLLAGLSGAVGAEPPALPATPAAVTEVLYARPFTLDEAYTHLWRQEQPQVRDGMLLVVKVDPALVYPRQVAEPVLYVGNQTAMRLNVGYPSGIVVALVPGMDNLPAAGADIWFGTPRLPETITARTLAEERGRAAHLAARAGSETGGALLKGGAPLRARNLPALLGEAAQLVRQHAPDEAALADGLAGQAGAP